MFSGLRQNSIFYVLDKGENPTLRIAQVVSVSNPQTKYPNFNGGYNPTPLETTVDVKVRFQDNTEMTFQQLPSAATIANDKQMVVSENKDAMSAEIESMHRQSQAILESIDYHRKVVKACEVMLSQINPQIAKEKEQSEKINALEGRVNGIDDKLDRVIGILEKTAK